jgi:adenine phosphoribosyltransferase
MSIEQKVRSVIRDIPDFPEKGVLFRDISPLLASHTICKEVVAHFCSVYRNSSVDAVAGIESRGFIFGPAIAFELGLPFVMIRKKGKLPFKTVSLKYDLEYGSAEIEMHIDAIKSGDKVLLHDDVLATGGTAIAAAKLLEKQGANVAGLCFLLELSALKGREKLDKYSKNICTLVSY